ncbi:MAG: trypsin-like serine protease, partial [Bacteroidota bacterium]
MNFRFFGLFIVFLILILTTACEEEEGIDQPEGIITFGIRHDKSLSEYEAIAASNNPNRPDFNTVVAFSYSLDGSQNEEFIASGTLINEEWILTAGHNFYDAEEQNSPAPASGITVKVGNDPNNPDQTYEVAEIVYHPTWLANQQDYEDANDLCLVKLSTPVTNLIPTPLHTTKSEILGTDIWFCGFGDYSS